MTDPALYDSIPQRAVEIEGFQVHLVDAGAGEPIVLVHGSPTSSFLFRHQIAALSRHFRVIAPDLLGFGRSAAPPGGTAFRQQAQVLRALLDHLGLERFALPGMNAPTLILWGEPDGYFRAPEMRRLHALLPHAVVHPIPKDGTFLRRMRPRR